MKHRAVKVMIKGAVILTAGCAYYVWLSLTGLGIPCVFHLVTGLKCPGCGVTRMLISLLRLDLSAAFSYNAVLLCLLPLLLSLGLFSLIRYVRTGNRSMTRAENALIYAAAAVLIIWGVVRNLPGITFG
ncbi:MAG: DUF2752 domain-containing protein [Clostridia bacterium]|nr:DUF2752 domain-containing protein [Clostridia bacterium]